LDRVPPSDEELVGRTCAGDTEAFGQLVERHQDQIYNAVLHLVGARHDAEDLTQEVFLKAYRSIGGFRGQAAFGTWLYSIMLNCVRSHWRAHGRRPESLSLGSSEGGNNPGGLPASREGEPLREAVRYERVAIVRKAIGELAPELKEVLVLRDREGLSYEELAASLKLPLGTVKSRLFRARSALKDRLGLLLGGEF